MEPYRRKGEDAKEKSQGKEDASASVSRREIEIDGNRILIVRHFVGEKDFGAVMEELAAAQASREMGL